MYLVNNALLDFSFWKSRLNCLCKSGQAIYTCNQDISDCTVFLTVHNGQPELCNFILPDIHPKNIFMSTHIYANVDIDSFFYDSAFAFDMKVDGIHKNYSIDIFQGALSPGSATWAFLCDREYFVCNETYCTVGNIYSIELLHVTFNTPGGHPFGIHGYDFFPCPESRYFDTS